MWGADGRRAVALCGWLLLCGLALMGCREDEVNRVIQLDKGKYPGELNDDALSLPEDTVQALNERALTQQF